MSPSIAKSRLRGHGPKPGSDRRVAGRHRADGAWERSTWRSVVLALGHSHGETHPRCRTPRSRPLPGTKSISHRSTGSRVGSTRYQQVETLSHEWSRMHAENLAARAGEPL